MDPKIIKNFSKKSRPYLGVTIQSDIENEKAVNRLTDELSQHFTLVSKSSSALLFITPAKQNSVNDVLTNAVTISGIITEKTTVKAYVFTWDLTVNESQTKTEIIFDQPGDYIRIQSSIKEVTPIYDAVSPLTYVNLDKAPEGKIFVEKFTEDLNEKGLDITQEDALYFLQTDALETLCDLIVIAETKDEKAIENWYNILLSVTKLAFRNEAK